MALSEKQEKYLHISGATASVIIIYLVLNLFNLVNDVISSAILFSVSVPIVLNFLLSLIFNKPKFSLNVRKWGIVAYGIILIASFMYIYKPETLTESLILLAQFLISFILVFISSMTYYLFYRLLKNKKYRIKAIVSLSASLLLTGIVILFISKINIIYKLIG